MHETSVTVLCSGSGGNSTLVMSNGRGVLLDAGMSCRELERRLSFFGVDESQVDAVVLSHEHTDHTRGARRFCADNDISCYGTRGTLSLTPLEGVRTSEFKADQLVRIGEISITPFRVKHLAAEPVAFSVSTDSVRIGFASDLGCVSDKTVSRLRGCDLTLIEANYDEEMLVNGSYPQFLKKAIMSDHGHLSNDDAGLLASATSTESTRRIVLLHLSRENNTPDLAKRAVEHAMRKKNQSTPICATEYGGMNGPFTL